VNDDVIFAADHNELATAFDQVKATICDSLGKDISPHFPFNIANGTTYDATCLSGFRGEHMRKPTQIGTVPLSLPETAFT